MGQDRLTCTPHLVVLITTWNRSVFRRECNTGTSRRSHKRELSHHTSVTSSGCLKTHARRPFLRKSPVQLQTVKEVRKILRRTVLVVRLLVSVRTSCAMPSEVLSCLLWRERHGVAKLFEAMDMVTLDTPPILLVKVISSQVGIGFLGT